MLSDDSYEVGPFTDIASEWGQQLWAFLNEPDIARSMTEASDIQRPAAEAIAYELHQRFGDDVRQDRVKQFTGYLIRQVMEGNGYRHSSYGQRTRENPVFVTASVYTRRDE